MQHFHIIVAIMNPFPQNPQGDKSTRETSQQVDEAPGTERRIPEDVLLVDFVKRRKIKKKWLKKYWVIIFYNIMSCMVFSAIELIDGLMNARFYWMNVLIEWMNGLMNARFYWMNLLTERMDGLMNVIFYWVNVFIEWMNGLMNVSFYWMNLLNEWRIGLMNVSFYWMNGKCLFMMKSAWICTIFFSSACIGFGKLRVMWGREGP